MGGLGFGIGRGGNRGGVVENVFGGGRMGFLGMGRGYDCVVWVGGFLM